ncbi:MAG: DUF6208 family protein [Methylomagnum sp.]
MAAKLPTGPGAVLLGVASFLFFRVMRVLLHGLFNRAFPPDSPRALIWRPFSGEALCHPLALPVVMTTGPRLNPHAALVSVGPVSVLGELAVDRDAILASAGRGSIVVYAYPSRACVECRTIRAGSGSGEEIIPLPPGRYVLALRYYDHHPERLLFPAVTVDGEPRIAAAEYRGAINAFYGMLARRGNGFYRLLNYYCYPMLRWRDKLSAAWVERQFLPVGNPDTRFVYGALRAGESFAPDFGPEIYRDYAVYATLHDVASFPVAWKECQPGERIGPAAVDGYCLVRLVERAISAGL